MSTTLACLDLREIIAASIRGVHVLGMISTKLSRDEESCLTASTLLLAWTWSCCTAGTGPELAWDAMVLSLCENFNDNLVKTAQQEKIKG